jgi:hypothetical protein
LSRSVKEALEDNVFSMSILQDAINITRKRDNQVIFDLKATFHHIGIHPECYELLGFQVLGRDGVVLYYCFVVLVFGLKIAAQVLGRVMKPVCTFLIQNGIPVGLYIDDGRSTGPTKERRNLRYKFALDVIEKAGLLISPEKSSNPEDMTQRVEYLGVILVETRILKFWHPLNGAFICLQTVQRHDTVSDN